jgi:hypothetical protein
MHLTVTGREIWSCARRVTLPVLPLLLALCLLSGCRVFKGDNRVAFLGDSITQGWGYPAAVLAGHGYAKIIILGGTNDVLLGIEPEITVNNLEKIALAVQGSGAEPVLCEIPPIFHSLKVDDAKDYSNDVRRLNEQIARLAAEHRWRLVDYYHPLRYHPHVSSDGVHMKRRGYLLMEIALLRAVPDA